MAAGAVVVLVLGVLVPTVFIPAARGTHQDAVGAAVPEVCAAKLTPQKTTRSGAAETEVVTGAPESATLCRYEPAGANSAMVLTGWGNSGSRLAALVKQLANARPGSIRCLGGPGPIVSIHLTYPGHERRQRIDVSTASCGGAISASGRRFTLISDAGATALDLASAHPLASGASAAPDECPMADNGYASLPAVAGGDSKLVPGHPTGILLCRYSEGSDGPIDRSALAGDYLGGLVSALNSAKQVTAAGLDSRKCLPEIPKPTRWVIYHVPGRTNRCRANQSVRRDE